MITKKQFCEIIIENFCRDNNTQVNDGLVTQSSKVAVAMEYLGLIESEEMKEFASERGGILFLKFDEKTGKTDFLTVREMINLLPE